MNFFLRLLLVSFFIVSCGNKSSKKKEVFKSNLFSKVEIKTILEDSTLNIRALEFVSKEQARFATSEGKIGTIDFNAEKNKLEVKFYPYQLKQDTVVTNFRSLAVTRNATFALGIGSPAILYKCDDLNSKIVYKERHPKTFYDALAFWNDAEGIAIGDPTENCLSIIITRNGGASWTKLLCSDLPDITEGEAAFAASDTNIKIIGDNTWIATGGKASRIFFSPDKGRTWQVFETPIVQGISTTGIYSIDFYNELNGFAIGGDYTKPEQNTANKIRTKDGGKTWELVAENRSPGYRSCIQYVPNSNSKSLIAIGFKGIDISNDFGVTWKHLSDDSYYTLRFINDSTAYAAGKGKISKLFFN